jgi:microcystin-dependent protein
MAQPYVGEIRVFAGNFAPAGWQFCEGQLLPISENETLFQLIGTTYGGDGQSTFALPDLRGRLPIHQGNGSILAETGGAEEVTLTVNQIPAHAHAMLAADGTATGTSPAGNVPGEGSKRIYRDPSALAAMAPASIGSTGGGQPHTNMQPYLCVEFIISLFGIFRSVDGDGAIVPPCRNVGIWVGLAARRVNG